MNALQTISNKLKCNVTIDISGYSPDGLSFKIYNNYMGFDTNYFKNNIPVNGQSGFTKNFTNINTATAGIVPSNNSRERYSVEWFGYFIPNESGIWTFTMGSDDCSYLWLGNNANTNYDSSNVFISLPGQHGYYTISNTTNLIFNNIYPIRIQFGENGGGDIITLEIKSPSNIIYITNIPFYQIK